MLLLAFLGFVLGEVGAIVSLEIFVEEGGVVFAGCGGGEDAGGAS
jgi:hypothetical protein